jgi:hypothetical protein
MRNLGMQVQEASRWGGPDRVLQKWARCSGRVLDCMGRDSTHRYHLIRGLLNASDARTSYAPWRSVFQSCAFAHDSKSWKATSGNSRRSAARSTV